MHYDTFFSERTLHEGSPSALDRALAARGGEDTSTARRGRSWLRTTTFRGRQGSRRDPVQRRADLPGGRHRLHPEQARAGVRAAAVAGRGRPPRLRARAQGGDGRAGRRSRHDRGPDPAVRPPRRRGRGVRDVQAPGRFRDARRPARRDRGRRHAVLHAPALARPDARARRRAGPPASRPKTPSTTSSTRTPGSPRCSARFASEAGRRSARSRGGLGRRPSCTAPSAV